MIELNENWRVDLLFPDEFHDFIAEIYYRDEFVCLIDQENGYDRISLEIAKKPNGENWRLNLSDFEQAVEKAKQRLWELRENKK